MSNKLKLYILNSDGTSAQFPSSVEQLVLSDYSASYNRMGAAPEITANVQFPRDIDHLWSYDVYVEFRGEKFFLKNLPKYTKNNTNHQYEYPLTFVSERSVLDGKYMVDAVQSDSSIDGYQSNSTKVVFMGDIHEFAKRLSAAMAYSGLDYSVVVDEGITTDPIFVSFDNKMLSEAISEGFNLYKIPYYFIGKVCHFGYFEHDFQNVLSYGSGNGLTSLGETNSGQRIVNRISGQGSSENIPFYYPNNSPLGNIELFVIPSNIGLKSAKIKNYRKVADKFGSANRYAKYSDYYGDVLIDKIQYNVGYRDTGPGSVWKDIDSVSVGLKGLQQFFMRAYFTVESNAPLNVFVSLRLNVGTDDLYDNYAGSVSILNKAGKYDDKEGFKGRVEYRTDNQELGNYYVIHEVPSGHYVFEAAFSAKEKNISDVVYSIKIDDNFAFPKSGWKIGDNVYSDNELGISYDDEPVDGDVILLNGRGKVPFSTNLMPPIYRESLGRERFYNAKNVTYIKPDGSGDYYEFKNEYSPSRPNEYIEDNEKVKPSIKGMTNSSGLRIDMFSEFAYDLDDNDDTITSEEGSEDFVHPYFYGKLRKFDGEYGFNLFDHSLENGEMIISMTSGVCGACNFTIVVDENTQRNIVMVNENTGNLMRDSDGRVLMAADSQGMDSQNDTLNNEVWVALKKDISTYGQVMPNVEYSHYPSVEDTFVILHIDLPESYIRNAENELKEHLIETMYNRNVDSYNPSILFSRIYLKTNDEYRENLNENSRIKVERSGKVEYFLISEISYNFSKKEILPDITVQLQREFISVSSSVSSIVDSVKDGVVAEVSAYSVLNDKFLRKDITDVALNKMAFKRGVEFDEIIGTSNFRRGNITGTGGAMYKDENGDIVVETDKIVVRKTAEFNQLVINQTSFQLGATIFSSAGCKITRVEEIEGAYRCYYDNEDGNRRSGFYVGDQARCQRYSPNYNGVVKYYWRLVLGVGDDYVDLAIDGFDDTGAPMVSGNDIPSEGDEIVHFGNRTDDTRQSAILLDPRNGGAIEVYSGINSFDLTNRNYVGMGVNPSTNRAYLYGYGDMFFGDRTLTDQYITFQIPEGKTEPELFIKGNVSLGAGSSGLSNLSEFASVKEQINDIKEDVDAVISATDTEYTIWFFDPEPTLNNAPAVDWATDEDKMAHDQDLYYSDDLGRAWRFISGTWAEITDENTIVALGKAQEAVDKSNEAKSAVEALSAEVDKSIASALEQSKSYTDDAKSVINERISQLESSKANLADVYNKSQVDGLIDDSEKDAISAAKNYTNEQNDLLEEEVKAWADGEISQAEADAIEEAQKRVDAAKSELDSAIAATSSSLSEYINSVKKELQAQIDGAIDSWFYDYEPTLENYPASEWIANGEEELHLNDTFTKLDDGRSWRWAKSGDTYAWVEILDSASSEALALASKAKDIADGKRRVFVEQPYPPYDIGDLWAQGNDGDLMVCKVQRGDGATFVITDWQKSTKYTDDTTANNALTIAQTATDKIIGLTTRVDQEGERIDQLGIDLEEVKSQRDQEYTIWFEPDSQTGEIPTLNNFPASSWTNAEKEEHDQDLYYSDSLGRAWRFVDGSWVEITDTRTIEALDKAQEAVDVAEDAKAQANSLSESIDITIENLKKESEEYTDEAKKELQKSIATLESAKANLTDVYNRAQVDGKITEVESSAINAAVELAESAKNFAVETSKAYADGEIDKEEQARLEQASQILKEAQDAFAKASNAMDKATENESALDDINNTELLTPADLQMLETERKNVESYHAEIEKASELYDINLQDNNYNFVYAEYAYQLETAIEGLLSGENVDASDLVATRELYYAILPEVMKEIQVLTQSNSRKDLDYIKSVFPNSTLVAGATISQLLGVNREDNIVAGIYGGGVDDLNNNGFKDSTHGTLMLFAGAENIDTASESDFRVYEDGTTFSKFVRKTATTINSSNLTKYIMETVENGVNDNQSIVIDIQKTGPIIEFFGRGLGDLWVQLPARRKFGYFEGDEWVPDGTQIVRPSNWGTKDFLSITGTTLCIINKSSNDINICDGFVCRTLGYGKIFIAKMVVSAMAKMSDGNVTEIPFFSSISGTSVGYAVAKSPMIVGWESAIIDE